MLHAAQGSPTGMQMPKEDVVITLRESRCPNLRETGCPNLKESPYCGDQSIGPIIEDTGQPCGEATEAGGAGVTMTRHALGNVAGDVAITYDMQVVPDRMDVYLDGVLVATTGEPVSGTGTLSFHYSATGQKYCKVKVTGPQGTAWSYTLSCPVL